MSSPRFLALFAAVVFCVAALTQAAHAQSSPTRVDKSVPVAHVRLWKADLRNCPPLRVVLTLPGSSPRQRTVLREMGGGGPGYQFNNYAELPSGQGTLLVSGTASGGTAQPHALVSLPVDFAVGSFVTILLDEPRKAGAPPQLDVIVDATGGAAPDDSTSQIKVRNFVVGLQDVRVTFGDTLNAQFAGGNSYLQMRGLKPIVYPVKTAGTGADGKPFEWITEADLRQHHHQTLLIYPDPYGRVRPRMSVDGENPAEPVADKEEQR